MKQSGKRIPSAGWPNQPTEPKRRPSLNDRTSGELQGSFHSEPERKTMPLTSMDEQGKTSVPPLQMERIVDIIQKVKKL